MEHILYLVAKQVVAVTSDTFDMSDSDGRIPGVKKPLSECPCSKVLHQHIRKKSEPHTASEIVAVARSLPSPNSHLNLVIRSNGLIIVDSSPTGFGIFKSVVT